MKNCYWGRFAVAVPVALPFLVCLHYIGDRPRLTLYILYWSVTILWVVLLKTGIVPSKRGRQT